MKQTIMTEGEKQAAAHHLGLRNGQKLCAGYHIGDTVIYQGRKYLVYDHQANDNAQYGSDPILCNYQNMIVAQWDTISEA